MIIKFNRLSGVDDSGILEKVLGMQKEKLSALMDGETLDNELLDELSHSPEMQQTWESYHLIRDSLRGDTRRFSISISQHALWRPLRTNLFIRPRR